MQSILLGAIIFECMLLIIFAIIKKLTKNMFYVITAVSVVGCIVGLFLAGNNNHADTVVDQRSYMYMTARLVQDCHYEEALEPLGQVINDTESNEVCNLRGLVYNLNQLYQNASFCVENIDDEYAKQIYDCSIEGVSVDDEQVSEICNNILSVVSADDQEKNLWEAQMRVQYLDVVLAQKDVEQYNFHAYTLAKDKITKDDYSGAYEIIASEAEQNNIQADVILSQMYVLNYNLRTLADGDAEYYSYWEDISSMEVDINRLNNELNQLAADDDAREEVQEEYDVLYAKYSNVWDELNRESVKRAINYLETIEYDQENIGYLLQLSYLYYCNHNDEKALELLKQIFEEQEFGQDEWLKNDIDMLKRAYVSYLSTGIKTEYNDNFTNLMNDMYQSIFYVSNTTDACNFRDFLAEYLDELYSGFYVVSVDTNNFPDVVANVALNDRNISLTKEELELKDSGVWIEDFTVLEKEIDNLNLCFVVDRSGSMEGDYIKDCKRAICDSIGSLTEDTKIGLVSFESTARIDSELTDSKSLISNYVNGLTAGGGTNIASGLDLADDILQRGEGNKTIILLSDGYDADDGSRRLNDVLADLVKQDITVYTIGLKGCDENYLRKIAETTGGYFRLVEDSSDLIDVYKSIQDALYNIYQISYEVSDESEFREIELRATDSLRQALRTYGIKKNQIETEDVNNTDSEQQSDFFKQNGGVK